MNGATVKVYSLAKDGQTRPFMSNGKRCTNFTVKEFACHDGTDPVFISPTVVDIMQDVRTHYGRPVHVSNHSAYRTPSHNKREGGSAYSYHQYGRAVDFHVEGVAHTEVAAYLETRLPNTGGIGVYSWGVHVDDRKEKSRWNG